MFVLSPVLFASVEITFILMFLLLSPGAFDVKLNCYLLSLLVKFHVSHWGFGLFSEILMALNSVDSW